MRHLKENLLVQFSVASFVIMFALAAGITSLLSTQLGHQIDDMEAHNALMMVGSDMVGMMADSGDQGHDDSAMGDMSASSDNHANDDSIMASMFNMPQNDKVMASTDGQAHNASMPSTHAWISSDRNRS